MCCTIPNRKLPATIIKYPALLLTPVFSYWSFGCASGCSCKGQNHVKVSWWLTWGNFIITFFGILSMLGIEYAKQSRTLTFSRYLFHDTAIGFIFIPLLILSWVSLIILQTLPKCYKGCCPCCQTNCFPIFHETVLDVRVGIKNR